MNSPKGRISITSTSPGGSFSVPLPPSLYSPRKTRSSSAAAAALTAQESTSSPGKQSQAQRESSDQSLWANKPALLKWSSSSSLPAFGSLAFDDVGGNSKPPSFSSLLLHSRLTRSTARSWMLTAVNRQTSGYVIAKN